MKYILGTILTIFCATASFDAFAGPEHNHVHIDQIGDDLVLNIDQQGKNQHIDLKLTNKFSIFFLFLHLALKKSLPQVRAEAQK